MDPSRKIKWLDSVKSYSYTYTGCENVPAEVMSIRDVEKPARMKAVCKHTFHCEAEAILSQQKKKRGENLAHIEKILPEVANLEWLQLSIHQIKAVEFEMIEELDSLRQIDANTGHISYSNEYRALEKQFVLLLEIHECLYMKAYLDRLDSVLTKKQQHDGTGKDANFTKKPSFLRRSLRFLIPFNKCIMVDSHIESG
jgi:hypothetical protein